MRACRVLAVSESGYYAQHRRPPSARTIRHALLTELIRRVHLEGRASYGARRVHAELVLGQGLVVGRCAVELLMRRTGIAGASGRPQFRRIPHFASAGDVVERRFRRDEPDRLWVTDITEHPTREGNVYCAVVLDVFSRRVVGWSIDATQTAALVTNALGMAIDGRRPDGTVIHSDQGTQFTSWAFTRRALDSGLMPSMGTVGSCFDNAMIESFWRRMQVELLDRRIWRTRVEAGQCDLRVPRDLPQPPTPSLSIGHAYPSRVRDSASDNDSGLISSNSAPRNPGQARVSHQTQGGSDTWEWNTEARAAYEEIVEAALGLVGARVAGSDKKGGDKGIDGRLYFHEWTSETRQIVFSVKAGHLVPNHVRDLRGVIEREKAEIGDLISFEEPTAGMRSEAAEAGFYRPDPGTHVTGWAQDDGDAEPSPSPWGRHPRIQLRTIRELLNGRGIDYPHVTGANITLRKAQRIRGPEPEPLELFETERAAEESEPYDSN